MQPLTACIGLILYLYIRRSSRTGTSSPSVSGGECLGRRAKAFVAFSPRSALDVTTWFGVNTGLVQRKGVPG